MLLELLPPEAQYLACVLKDRWYRAHGPDADAGLETLQVIVLAALLVPAALAAGAFLVAKINAYQSKIK